MLTVLTHRQLKTREYNQRSRQKILADPEKLAERKQKMREYNRQYKLRHPDRIEDGRLRKLYGISRQEMLDLEQKQNSCCAICELPFGTGALKRFIDHDHSSKKVRGLLHSKCNTYLGVIENKEFRTKAENYLARQL
jgi:hypothetical protein